MHLSSHQKKLLSSIQAIRITGLMVYEETISDHKCQVGQHLMLGERGTWTQVAILGEIVSDSIVGKERNATSAILFITEDDEIFVAPWPVLKYEEERVLKVVRRFARRGVNNLRHGAQIRLRLDPADLLFRAGCPGSEIPAERATQALSGYAAIACSSDSHI